MEIRILKNNDDIYLTELSGDLDIYSSNQVKDKMMKMIKNRIKHFIISLKGVENINSAGIGALIYISSTLKNLNCPLIVIAPEGPAKNALEVTRLTSYFTIVPSLKEALALVK